MFGTKRVMDKKRFFIFISKKSFFHRKETIFSKLSQNNLLFIAMLILSGLWPKTNFFLMITKNCPLCRNLHINFIVSQKIVLFFKMLIFLDIWDIQN